MENKVRIDIISLFSDDIKDRPGWKVYSGICILVEFPDKTRPKGELKFLESLSTSQCREVLFAY